MPDAPKSILVTGSNQGLGFFVAQKLLAHSDHLIVYVAARTKEKAKEATEKLKGAQDTNPIHSIVPIVIDLTDDSTIDAAVSQIEALDILVNNAGLYGGCTKHVKLDAEANELNDPSQRRLLFTTEHTRVSCPEL